MNKATYKVDRGRGGLRLRVGGLRIRVNLKYLEYISVRRFLHGMTTYDFMDKFYFSFRNYSCYQEHRMKLVSVLNTKRNVHKV